MRDLSGVAARCVTVTLQLNIHLHDTSTAFNLTAQQAGSPEMMSQTDFTSSHGRTNTLIGIIEDDDNYF